VTSHGQPHVELQGARRRARGSGVAATAILGIGLALASPGDLDLGFNGNGILSLHVSDFGSVPFAVVQQLDGKLVFAGFGGFPDDGSDFVAVRVLPDGTPDNSFGTNGIARTDFAGLDDIALDVIEQADGKLVLAGRAGSDSGTNIALERLNDNGTLDATFGASGWATLDLGGSDDIAQGLVLQSDGDLVVAGRTDSGGFTQLIFARFHANGSLDTTFGDGGTTLVDFDGAAGSEAFTLANQADDKLVAAGRVFLSAGGQRGAIVRVTADGVLDPTFDGDGRVDVDTGGLFGIAMQPDGAIVIAGYVDAPAAGAALLRFNEDGSTDDSFGIAGKAIVDLGEFGSLNSVVVQTDGKLVATGTRSIDVDSQDMVLVRFNSDGTLDTNYGTDGVATADFGAGDIAPFSNGNALIQQIDGKHVAVGPNSIGSFGAARFDNNAAC
jgi:uncharacterized delta-60 repeat protein